MLRESSVPYSSLPQEEDVGQAYITTRTAAEAQTRSNRSRILSIIVALLLICGVPLLIIAPLALRRANGHGGTSVTETANWGIPDTESHERGDGGSPGNDNSGSITNKTDSSSGIVVTNTPPKIGTAAPLVTDKAEPTTTTTTTTTTTSTTTTTPTTTTTTTPTTSTTTTTTEPPTTGQPIIIEPTNSILKPTVEVPTAEETGKDQSGGASKTTVMPLPTKEAGSSGGGSSDDGDSALPTSTQNISYMMNNFLFEHEWWTVVGLGVAAALAISAVIAAVAWIIQRRLYSRRRMTNLQRVITDLQSRDKVVLLNSEDSEDEA